MRRENRRVATAILEPCMRIGLVTDIHYHRQIRYGNRHCPDSLTKLKAPLLVFREQKVDLIANLGDSIDCHGCDTADTDSLADLQRVLATAPCPIVSVMGNHDLEGMDKRQFRQAFGLSGRYPGERIFKDCRLLLLDANFSAAGQDTCGTHWDWRESFLLPSAIAWLARQLAESRQSLNLVLVHQNLHDRLAAGRDDPHVICNAEAVRQVMEGSGRRIIVLQGHNHAGGRQDLNGIVYLTLRAMCEGPGLANNAFAILDTDSDGSADLIGFGSQTDETIRFPTR